MEKHKKLFFFVVGITMFVINFANSVQGVLLSDFVSFYGLESTSKGYMGTFQSIGCILVCLFMILIAGRVKKHKLLVFSVTCVFASLLGRSFMPGSYSVFLIFYFIFGLAYASASTISSSITAQLYKGNAVAMGLNHAFLSFGGIIGPLLLRAARKNMEWNQVCLMMAAVALAILLIYLVTTKICQDVTATLKEDNSKITGCDVKGFFGQGRNILLTISAMGYLAFQQCIIVWLPTYMSTCLGVDDLSAITLSLFWIGCLLARLLVPRIKLRTEILYTVGCLLSAALIVGGILSGNATVMMVCVILGGFASGACVPQFFLLGSMWSKNSMLSSNVLGVAMYTSSMIASPITATATAWTGGAQNAIIATAIYVFASGVAMLPMALKKDTQIA